MAESFFVHGDVAKYRVVRPWQQATGVFPVSQIAVSPDDRVYLLRRERPMIMVFDAAGRSIDTLDHPRLVSAHGICIAPDGRVLVSTYDAHQVLIFDRDHRPLGELGRFGEPRWGEPFNSPTGIAVAASGDIYVADGYGNARIHRFRADGSWRSSWGEPGAGPGEFSTPHAVSVLPDGRVLVCDRDNDRIQVFDAQGGFLAAWGPFVRPMDLWVDPAGRVFVTEQTPRISVCDTTGRVIGRMRAFGVYPHGIAGDSSGGLYVAEQGPEHHVTKYEPCG
jgi:DNA-binding beta-propeller fold protein YncE